MRTDFSHFRFWCQKVLPLVYDDSLSYYEVLGKVVKYLNDIIDEQKEFTTIVTQMGQEIDVLQSEMDFVQSELEKVKKGDYLSLYLDSLTNWIDNNLQELVGRIVKYVAFYLDDSGHLCADIPSTWQFLRFDTIVDTNNVNYGHLVLEW
jgi:hypothetical protein